MTDSDYRLTVDDLIIEYMIYKVRYGYEPSFLTSEFMNFLSFFESKMEVDDSLYESTELFQRFFERNNKRIWNFFDFSKNEEEVLPAMEMIYSEENKDYIIKANYRLSNYDASVINTYKMGKGKTQKIRSIIGEYLSDKSKRKIDESIEINDNDLIAGKYAAAEIITNIWDSYVDEKIEYNVWPEQCRDINKYLFEIDLAEIINVKSIKNELIELYEIFSKRVAILYHQDKNLEISTGGSYLARANYKLLIQSYEKIMNQTFRTYKKSLEIDLSTLTFKESHEIDGIMEDSAIETITTADENGYVKKLVKNFEKITQNS